MIIPLGVSDTELPSENISRIRLRNTYLIENPQSPDKLTRVSRPTLTRYFSLSGGPINGLWRQPGSIGSKWLVLSGEMLYTFDGISTNYLGRIPGTGRATFSGNILKALILRDGSVYSTDGNNLLSVAIPDSQLIDSIGCIDSVFILTVKDSQVFYWMNPEEITPDPLSFASVERTPDAVTTVAIASDEVWFIGTSSTEVWQQTGNQDAPYQRIAGRAYSDGCVDRDTVCVSNYNGYPCIVWVTDKKFVVMAQGNPVKVSNPTVEEFLSDATNLTAWMFKSNKNTFYVLSSDEKTYVYDLDMKTWSRWDSFNSEKWRAQCGLQVDRKVYAGDSESGTIFFLDEGVSDDGDPVIREVSGWLPITDKHVTCKSINVRVNPGWGSSYTEEQLLEMRFSDDGGETFSEYQQVSLGLRGRYDSDVTFRSLGMMYRPGRDFEFRFSGVARFRLDYATVNEV